MDGWTDGCTDICLFTYVYVDNYSVCAYMNEYRYIEI